MESEKPMKQDSAEISDVAYGICSYVDGVGKIHFKFLGEPTMAEILGLVKYTELEVNRQFLTK
jgi:hypothetical protein